MPAHNPIVIVGAARTPIGAFQGDLKDAPHPSSAPPPSAPQSSALGIPPDAVDEVVCRLRAPGGHGPGSRAAGYARRRPAAFHRRSHHQ